VLPANLRYVVSVSYGTPRLVSFPLLSLSPADLVRRFVTVGRESFRNRGNWEFATHRLKIGKHTHEIYDNVLTLHPVADRCRYLKMNNDFDEQFLYLTTIGRKTGPHGK
jgi:hypothetical protein